MQIAVEIPDKLGKKFIKKYKNSQRKKIMTEAIKKKLNREHDPLWDITNMAQEVKDKDIAKNHDKYLNEEIIKQKVSK